MLGKRGEGADSIAALLAPRSRCYVAGGVVVVVEVVEVCCNGLEWLVGRRLMGGGIWSCRSY